MPLNFAVHRSSRFNPGMGWRLSHPADSARGPYHLPPAALTFWAAALAWAHLRAPHEAWARARFARHATARRSRHGGDPCGLCPAGVSCLTPALKHLFNSQLSTSLLQFSNTHARGTEPRGPSSYGRRRVANSGPRVASRSTHTLSLVIVCSELRMLLAFAHGKGSGPSCVAKTDGATDRPFA